MHWKYLWVVERCDEDSNNEFRVDLMEVWPSRAGARAAKKALDGQFPDEKHRVTPYISTRYLKEVV